MKLMSDIEHVKMIFDGLHGDIWAHDVLAAHALLQAIEEELHMMDSMNVHERADELMREWTTSEPSSNQP